MMGRRGGGKKERLDGELLDDFVGWLQGVARLARRKNVLPTPVRRCAQHQKSTILRPSDTENRDIHSATSFCQTFRWSVAASSSPEVSRLTILQLNLHNGPFRRVWSSRSAL